jgi:hypothetical protein
MGSDIETDWLFLTYSWIGHLAKKFHFCQHKDPRSRHSGTNFRPHTDLTQMGCFYICFILGTYLKLSTLNILLYTSPVLLNGQHNLTIDYFLVTSTPSSAVISLSDIQPPATSGNSSHQIVVIGYGTGESMHQRPVHSSVSLLMVFHLMCLIDPPSYEAEAGPVGGSRHQPSDPAIREDI